MRVLIADGDDAFIGTLKSDFHDRHNVECQTVSNGLQCLKSLREFKPDILVLQQSLLWGGSGGVLAVMQDYPELALISVIISTDAASERPYPHPNLKVIAELQKPFSVSDVVKRFEDRPAKASI